MVGSNWTRDLNFPNVGDSSIFDYNKTIKVMRVICIQDGIDDFGQSPNESVKEGEIYHILHSMPSGSLGVPPQNPHKGDWYHFIERGGWHWHGLFEPLGWDEELEEEVQKEYSQLN